uniref:Uncharacterized protein n=1 Tax=Parastrongyloides trichosuri TaxID=131310 RepID=A0A0N4ZJL8_PARTI
MDSILINEIKEKLQIVNEELKKTEKYLEEKLQNRKKNIKKKNIEKELEKRVDEELDTNEGKEKDMELNDRSNKRMKKSVRDNKKKLEIYKLCPSVTVSKVSNISNTPKPQAFSTPYSTNRMLENWDYDKGYLREKKNDIKSFRRYGEKDNDTQQSRKPNSNRSLLLLNTTQDSFVKDRSRSKSPKKDCTEFLWKHVQKRNNIEQPEISKNNDSISSISTEVISNSKSSLRKLNSEGLLFTSPVGKLILENEKILSIKGNSIDTNIKKKLIEELENLDKNGSQFKNIWQNNKDIILNDIEDLYIKSSANTYLKINELKKGIKLFKIKFDRNEEVKNLITDHRTGNNDKNSISKWFSARGQVYHFIFSIGGVEVIKSLDIEKVLFFFMAINVCLIINFLDVGTL